MNAAEREALLRAALECVPVSEDAHVEVGRWLRSRANVSAALDDTLSELAVLRERVERYETALHEIAAVSDDLADDPLYTVAVARAALTGEAAVAETTE